MNKIITFTATLVTIVLTSIFGPNAQAEGTINPIKDYNSHKITNAYLEAIVTGNIDLNKYFFTSNFEYQNSANSSTSNRKQYTDFLKKNKGLTFDCKTSFTILDETGNTSLAKATFVFSTFTRVDYITLVQTNEGWKISKIISTYP